MGKQSDEKGRWKFLPFYTFKIHFELLKVTIRSHTTQISFCCLSMPLGFLDFACTLEQYSFPNGMQYPLSHFINSAHTCTPRLPVTAWFRSLFSCFETLITFGKDLPCPLSLLQRYQCVDVHNKGSIIALIKIMEH